MDLDSASLERFQLCDTPTAMRQSTATTAQLIDRFSYLPACLLAFTPSVDLPTTPTTPHELMDLLGGWVDYEPSLWADVDELVAWQRYVRRTVHFAHEYGMDAALQYNKHSLHRHA